MQHRLRAAPTAADRERAAFLDEMCRVLWRAPEDGAAEGDELIVLPGARRPRLLVPPRRRVAAAAVRQYGEPRSRRSRLGTKALSLVLRSGAGGALFRDRVRLGPAGRDTIDGYLAGALGCDIEISMYLGAPRANRKPVLQLLAGDGSLAGFAKIGVSPLARRLVMAEHDALTALGEASLETVTVPAVLHYGIWHEMPVLVLGPLAVRERRVPLPPARLAQAMGAVSRMDGIAPAALAASPYWSRLIDRVEGVSASPPGADLRQALAEIADRAGDATLGFGDWHGDWTPWNMASTRNGLLVWDWERFARGVPIGYDVLHHWLQTHVVPGGMEPRAAARETIQRAPGLLEPFGADTRQAALTAVVYLAELATRQIADGQAAAGARLGDTGRWLVPAIAEGAREL